jgi:hypothetical protein
MAEPGSYEHAVERYDQISDVTKKRLVRDSDGNWHALQQSIYVLARFDDLIGLKTIEHKGFFRPDFERSRDIMDEAVREARRTGFDIDTCFQTVVLKLFQQTIIADLKAGKN